MNMLSRFSAAEASRLAGFEKPHMLNHLERSGTFLRENAASPHHGKRRVYTLRDVIVLRAINRLLLLGARPKRIAAAINTFQNMIASDVEDSLAEFAARSSLFVVTAEKILFLETPGQLVELAQSGQLAFSFMVDTRTTIGPVSEAIGALTELVRKRPGARNQDNLERIAKRFNL